MALHKSIENLIHALRYREVLPHVKPCHALVDLGCHPGYAFLKRVRHLAEKAGGLDMEAEDLEDQNITVRQGDITTGLPYEDNSVDQATLLAVIEHISNPPLILAEVWRVLRPGGRLIVTTPSRLGIWVHEGLRRLRLIQDVEEDEHKDFGMCLTVLTMWLTEAGFEIETAYSFELGMNLLAVGVKPRPS